MKSYSPQRLKKQRGAILFIMVMVLLALTIITLMTTNVGKSDAQISYAYAEKTKSFINAEEMLARLQFALEQVPIPEGIAAKGKSIDINTIIWRTDDLVKVGKKENFGIRQNEPEFTNPNFAEDWESVGKNNTVKTVLSCSNIETWLKSKLIPKKEDKEKAGQFILNCKNLDPDDETRTVIELISQRKTEGDIDELRDVYYYRITIYAKGDNSGRSLIQGITGVQYN